MKSSMANEIFIDTSGFYSLLARNDKGHEQASNVLADAMRERRKFITTDYVLDESVTLFRARRRGGLVSHLFDTLDVSTAISIEWTTAERFRQTRAFCLRHNDKTWLFTDCLSFVVMRELGLREALSHDHHFAQAGFHPLLSA